MALGVILIGGLRERMLRAEQVAGGVRKRFAHDASLQNVTELFIEGLLILEEWV